MEDNCYNSHDGKHELGNNTASLRMNGTITICHRCTCMFTPKEAFELFLLGHHLSEDLKKSLVRLCGITIYGYWLCQSCQQALSNDIDRVKHFISNHGYDANSYIPSSPYRD